MKPKCLPMLSLIAATCIFTGAAPAMAQSAPAQAAAQAATATPLPVPPGEYLLGLTRSTLAPPNQANLTGNYSVLPQLGPAVFRQATPPQRLTEIFAAFRQNRIDLTPIEVLVPAYTVAPHVRDGKLRLIGRFPSQPMQVNFDLTFAPEDGRWRLCLLPDKLG